MIKMDENNNGQGKGKKLEEGGLVEFAAAQVQLDSEQKADDLVALDQTFTSKDELLALKHLALYQQFLPYRDLNLIASCAISLYAGPRDENALITVGTCFKDIFMPYLEMPEAYRKEPVKPEAYKHLKLDESLSIDFRDGELQRIFPEFAWICKLDKSDARLLNNPYQYIMSIGLAWRPFLTAATKYAVDHKLIVPDYEPRRGFYKPLEEKHFIEFARSVGLEHDVAKYIARYEQE